MFSSRRRKWGLTLALVAFWVSGKYPALLDPNNLWGKNLGAFPRSPGAAKRDSASLDNRSPQECPGMTFCANARGRIISAILVVIAVTVADPVPRRFGNMMEIDRNGSFPFIKRSQTRGNFAPYSTTWSVEMERRLGRFLNVRTNYQQ